MSQAVVEQERRLPYTPAQLCALVGDVCAYPGFLPWVKGLTILKEEPLPEGGWTGVAEATVGWRGLVERFATHVHCAPAAGAVDVRLAHGPFRSLENRWRFTSDGAGGSRVRFWIAYEFRNPLLQAMAHSNRHYAANRIIAAFEAEAHRRFGPSTRPSSVESTEAPPPHS